MSLSVDLNADMGESFGPWVMGNDAALLNIITSANIACGFHAGDPDVMAATMGLAHEKGVGIGSHPGFQDLQGFGRRRIKLPDATLANLVRYQVAASVGMAKSIGAEVRHIKLHGAMSNMASEDPHMLRGFAMRPRCRWRRTRSSWALLARHMRPLFANWGVAGLAKSLRTARIMMTQHWLTGRCRVP